MKVGFTGTRDGMTSKQAAAFIRLVNDILPRAFHHGACVGADAEAAQGVAAVMRSICRVVVHPGRSAHGGDNEWLDKEAVATADEVRETKTHFARNRDIVNETDLLIATPRTGGPITSLTTGGTAYTVNYARKLARPVAIIAPDGVVTFERWQAVASPPT